MDKTEAIEICREMRDRFNAEPFIRKELVAALDVLIADAEQADAELERLRAMGEEDNNV